MKGSILSVKSNTAITGHRNSKSRKQILEVLGLLSKPATAEEIYLKLKDMNATISLSTVYRNLEFLTNNKLIKKFTVMDSNKAIYELNQHSHKHYLICTKCNKMTPISDCPVKNLEKAVPKDVAFNITGHKLEIYGQCAECK